MSLLGNILWLILGGIFIAIEYMVAGFILCITIIGIPFGIQCFKLAVLALFPFGREVVNVESGGGCLSTVMNILWIVTGGLLITLSHIGWAIICGITIIGLPFAKQHIKLAALALTPFGKDVR